jgi:pimeloyl-ACP methyl ester carboxylesterase
VSDILKGHDHVARGFGGSPGVRERLIRREDLSGDVVVAALAALLRSLGFEKATVVFEQSPAT